MQKIDDNHPMQELLHAFVLKWSEKAQILAFLTDDNHAFVSELNAFFMRGYVKYPSGGKNLVSHIQTINQMCAFNALHSILFSPN